MKKVKGFDDCIEKYDLVKWLYKFIYLFIIFIVISFSTFINFSDTEASNFIQKFLPSILNRIILFITISIPLPVLAYRYLIMKNVSIFVITFAKRLSLDILSLAFASSVAVTSMTVCAYSLYPSSVTYLEVFLLINTLGLFLLVPIVASIILEKNDLGKLIFGVKNEKKYN